jgi:hypothetical protein
VTADEAPIREADWQAYVKALPSLTRDERESAETDYKAGWEAAMRRKT